MTTIDDRAEATFLFDPANVRSGNDPSDDGVRLVWLFVSLLRKREIDFELYAKECLRGEKSLQRDVRKLREIGLRYGFTLTKKKAGIVRLASLDGLPDTRAKARAGAADALRALIGAFGEIVGGDVAGAIDLSAATLDPFLRIALPTLSSQSDVAKTYARLREAWLRKTRVRFLYPLNARSKQTTERTVEPHLITYYDGRYYLVAFDVRPRTRAWRQFALDRISSEIAPAGTFTPRVVPAPYRGENAIGLFKSGAPLRVTIELSPEIAAAVTARTWQRTQEVRRRSDGSAHMTFEVYDACEAVRFAMRFGTQARVVAPPQTVSLAQEMATQLLRAYAREQREPIDVFERRA